MSDNNANGRTFRERLLSRLIIDPSGCLLWTGGQRSNGYGQIGDEGAHVTVHRVMYEMFAGPVPEGLVLDHLCRVRRCANVAHLEPVTGRVNILRGASWSAVNARKSHCDAGKHPFDHANTYITPRGKRQCRACCRERAQRYRDRKRSARSAIVEPAPAEGADRG